MKTLTMREKYNLVSEVMRFADKTFQAQDTTDNDYYDLFELLGARAERVVEERSATIEDLRNEPVKHDVRGGFCNTCQAIERLCKLKWLA